MSESEPMEPLAHGIEHVAHAVEAGVESLRKGDPMGRAATDSAMRNFTRLMGIVSAIAGTVVGVTFSYAVNQYRLGEMEKNLVIIANDAKEQRNKLIADQKEQQTVMWNHISEMEKNGHKDHENRISKLEQIGADRTAQSVVEQGRQIAQLADVVRVDHDILMRLAAVMEQRVKPAAP